MVGNDQHAATTSVSIRKSDAIDLLRSLPDESIDLIVVDPAYESLEKHRKVGTTTRLTGKWFDIFENSRYPDMFAESYRVLKPNTHMYMFSDSETMFVAKPIGEQSGFKFWKDIVWDKRAIGMGYHYRCQNERILFFEKGKRALNSNSIPDILRYKRIRSKEAYPTEKPTALLKVLIGQSSKPGEVVLDYFAGSGSTGVAACEMGRSFIGSDVSESAISIQNQRMSQWITDQQCTSP